ncbi:FadD3 family acyl-CoA ligase [Actinophytocola algeriensis]|uniref:Acyl-CoA synthetase (AMP-forming)/AMP-acid ligase II n=1 Tax=Actinophytocola algeriensis TaxID=1768010 RepID=A0A7W7Q5B5_9PSEU|nr:FadD3 family acyl-CoA ligase [Actinophytocola algeriensis]MBB4907113.1 acyl-CoA synthetase (AMP-forming)/AMP-acid ligase II [Actinophytocola algeriensis]MBE1478596.1 acyl-CoA synthetase (AMP-forming)/AMP-acid ligase II [Actinophytocola algeriensis]
MDTIPAVVAAAAHRFGDAEALVDGPVRMSWRELGAQVRAAAGLFAENGVQPGDRVAVCAPNTHHWVLAALGALTAGATLVPVNTRFTAAETADILDRTRAKSLVVVGEFLGRDRLRELRDDGHRIPGHVMTIDPGTPWQPLDHAAPDVGTGPDDVSDILFTSGTTGRSKGAMSAHRQALGVARAWAGLGGVTQDDRYLVINPFFHSFGYKAGILVCLLTGATIVPQLTFDVKQAAELVRRERITVMPGPPTIFQSMLDLPGADLRTLRLAVTGAAVVPVTLVERMQREFGTVLTAYGLTEAVVATMCGPDDDAETVATTCGRPTAGFELRIGDQGEILLRGPNVMLGYLDDPHATAQAVDADGWLHTGDVGTVGDRGHLTITDRLKDMYISGGFNVYPAEVEQVLARLPGVTESAVVGVPDERLGEVGKAFVVANGLSTEDVIAHCRRLLANYKVPRQVEFTEALPRNASGKVLKRVLRDAGA